MQKQRRGNQEAIVRGICVYMYICTMYYCFLFAPPLFLEYYSAIKRNKIGSFVKMWMGLETVIQSEVSQKEKKKYCILAHICGI